MFPFSLSSVTSSSFLQVEGIKMSHLCFSWCPTSSPKEHRLPKATQGSVCRAPPAPQRTFLCCPSPSTGTNSSLGDDLWGCRICSNIPLTPEWFFLCLLQFSHRQEDRGQSGHQEAVPPVPVRDLCQESLQGADAAEAHAA